MIAKKTDRVVRRRKKIPPKKTREKREYRRLFFFFCIFVFFCVLVYTFFCSGLVSVLQISVQGTQRVEADSVAKIVKEKIDGVKFLCVRNNNFFLINVDDIVAEIKKDQRIKSVEITKTFPDTISIDVVEYDVVPIWCVGSLLGSCFELNMDGCTLKGVDINSQLVQDNAHFIIVDHGHESVDDHQCVITAEKLQKIQLLGEEFIYTLNVGIKNPYIIDFRGSGEVKYETDEGWYILVDLDHNVDEVLHVAQLFSKKVDLPSMRSDLEYVDLRFPEKMFYKMKEGVEQEESDEKDESDELNEKDEVDDERGAE